MGSSDTHERPQKIIVCMGKINTILTAVLSDLIATFPDPNNQKNLDGRIWFQQDGVPPYYGVNVRLFLINQFDGSGLESVDQ